MSEPVNIDLPPTLSLSRDGNIGHLRLTRADKRNALNDTTVLALKRLFAEPPEGIAAIVLSGDGQHFCAGLDLAEAAQVPDTHAAVLHSQMWHRAFHEIQFGRVPVVAVLHGAVVGGGLELAASTHVRVAEASAYYGLPEGQRGIFLGGGGSVRLPRLIGVARVQEMMFTGRTMSAEEGQTVGISQYLVADGQGLAKGTEIARKIANNTPITNMAIMHALPRNGEGDTSTGFFTESLMAAIAETAPEAKQRLNDFLEKRAAKVLPDKK